MYTNLRICLFVPEKIYTILKVCFCASQDKLNVHPSQSLHVFVCLDILCTNLKVCLFVPEKTEHQSQSLLCQGKLYSYIKVCLLLCQDKLYTYLKVCLFCCARTNCTQSWCPTCSGPYLLGSATFPSTSRSSTTWSMTSGRCLIRQGEVWDHWIIR